MANTSDTRKPHSIVNIPFPPHVPEAKTQWGQSEESSLHIQIESYIRQRDIDSALLPIYAP